MRRTIGCLIAGGLLLAGVALAQESGTIERDGLSFVEHIEKTVPARAHGTLRLTTPKGNLEVSPWDKDEVRVEVVKEVDAFTESSARDLPADAQVFVETAEGGVEVRVESDEDLDDLELEFHFSVPQIYNLDLHTSGGGIDIGDLEGQVLARTAGGGIEAELVPTDLKADAHCTLKTAGGNLSLYLPAELPATIDAQLRIQRKVGRDYRTYSDLPIAIQGEGTKLITGKGEVNGGGNLMKLYTTNGDIYIKNGPK
jgi:DUF4097 and DUF4098 domain-containing protein YvlB